MTKGIASVPAKLNGHPVIGAQSHPNGYVTVMVERKDDPMPYVVATWHAGLTEGWLWGHYLPTMEEACAVFIEVTERNASRQ